MPQPSTLALIAVRAVFLLLLVPLVLIIVIVALPYSGIRRLAVFLTAEPECFKLGREWMPHAKGHTVKKA